MRWRKEGTVASPGPRRISYDDRASTASFSNCDGEYTIQRGRLGALEQQAVDLVTEVGLGERLHRVGRPHDGIQRQPRGGRQFGQCEPGPVAIEAAEQTASARDDGCAALSRVARHARSLAS